MTHTRALLTLCLAVAAGGSAFAAEKPARSWLSIWSNYSNEFSGGASNRFTRALLFNPADPGGAGSATATVKVVYFQNRCWGAVATEESLSIPPGQFGSFSSQLAGFPQSLAGTGCLWIDSDTPVLPVNGHIYEKVSSFVSGEAHEIAQNTDFWRAGKTPGMHWLSYWEHSVPLGGPAFGGNFTGAYVLNPARQRKRTELLPPATATITHYKGACGVGPIWSQDVLVLEAGQFNSYDSAPDGVDTLGQGCVSIVSDQPVVVFNGSLFTTSINPASGQQSRSAFTTTFDEVDW